MSNEYFDAMAASWDDNPMRQKLAGAVWEFVDSCGILNENAHVMDYGCGTGLMSVRLSQKAKVVYAMDASTGMIGELCSKIDKSRIPNIRVVHHNMATDEPLKICPNVIASAMALHHIDDTADIIAKMASLLADSGHIILVDLCAEDGSFHTGVEVPHNGFKPAYIESLLSDNGMEIVNSQVIHEIVKNDEKYPVFGILAKKS